MLEIIQQYWQSLLWTDGYNITGLAMTLWILILSVLMGGILSLALAVGRNSPNKLIKLPIWLFTYIFRGTPLYVQLLIIYTGIYTLSMVKHNAWLGDFFQSGLNCTVLAFTLNTCAYTTEVFAGAMRNVPNGEIQAATALGFNRFQLYRYIIFPRAFRIA
ncbi:MAG: ABC transporter permease subunit, partial [Gilliamella sp.]|nr:ABC transporter permease subunit [Gilliamella sp.]